MNAVNAGLSDTLMVGGAVIALAATGAIALLLLSFRRLRSRLIAFETGVAALRREAEAAAAILTRTERRLERIEREHGGFGDRVRFVELRAGARSFDQAIDSARRGADPTKLTEQFGLSNSEAELVSRLHRQRK
jgi:hypothetical protein